MEMAVHFLKLPLLNPAWQGHEIPFSFELDVKVDAEGKVKYDAFARRGHNKKE